MPVTLNAAIGASASALNAERTRVEVAVSNIANAESTRGANGLPYRRREVVLEPAGSGDFDGALGVRVSGVVEDPTPFEEVHDPTHPDADANGMVKMPNVNTQEEVVDLLSASRAYQANLAAVTIIRDMVQKALDLGRG
jgi:flagellar basal-body rod protein FlgC